MDNIEKKSFQPLPGQTILNPFPASFTIPQNWQVGRQIRENASLVSYTEAGLIIVNAGIFINIESIYRALSNIFTEMKCTGKAVQGPRSVSIGRLEGTMADYYGSDEEGTPLAAHFCSVFSSKGLCMGAFGMTSPEKIYYLASRVDEITHSFHFGEFIPDYKAMASLAGQWSLYKGSSSGSQSSSYGGTSMSRFSSYIFNQDGTFNYSFESSISATSYLSGMGNQTSGFSSSSDSDQGSFFVAHGVIILVSQKYGSRTLDAHMEGKFLHIGNSVYAR